MRRYRIASIPGDGIGLEGTPAALEVLAAAGARHGFERLSTRAAVEHLPPHHADPFHRLLIAQAQIEGAALESRDSALRAYDVPVIW